METEPKGLSEHPTDDARIADSSMGDKLVELQIELDDTGLLVRGFAKYLELIDGFYGRSHPRGFRSYAHLPDEQVEFAEVRPGSLELIISEIVESSQTVAPVVVLYLLLKYLPEFLKSIISTYKDFEEAKYQKSGAHKSKSRCKTKMKSKISTRTNAKSWSKLSTRYTLPNVTPFANQ